jgi:hypothetical protein
MPTPPVPESPPAPWTAGDPQVTITVSEPGVLSVRMFGVAYPTPPEWGALTRSGFGQLMDHLYQNLGQPFSVEVVETDGTRHTGVIDLPQPPADQPAPVGAAPRRALPEFLPTPHVPTTPLERAEWAKPVDEDANDTTTSTVETPPSGSSGSGFLPGEQVAVTVVVGTTTADDTGHVDVAVPGWLSAGVLLLGRDSGHIAHIGNGDR